MLDQLLANISVDLKFFRRNRLILAIGIVFAAITAISTTGSLIFGSASGRFDIVQTIFLQLTWFTTILAAGLGLFLITSQVRSRDIKLVLTKPCPPANWLAAAFLSASGVSLLLHLLALLVVVVLSLVWGLPIQPGFAFLTIVAFIRSVIILGYLLFLTMAFHPVVAVLIAIVFSESTFYGLRMATLTAIKATGGNVLLPVLEKLSYAAYMVLPIASPYSEQYQTVMQSLRVTSDQWLTGLYAAAYALVLTLLFYLGALRLLQRKSLM